MYDTIEIRSPELSYDEINKIRMKSQVTERYDVETGEILYQVTTSQLEGSYDARLSVRVVQGLKLKISGSVHKFILGHNCWGGPKDIKKCCRYLVLLVQKKLGVTLPNWSDWDLLRADVTHVFNLGDIEAVQDYLRMMRGCTYPRRKPRNYGLCGYYFPGSSTTLKIYNKGPEFAVHDKPRLLKLKNNGTMFNKDSIELLENLSNGLIRFEVEVRSRKLRYDHQEVRCGLLEDEYFQGVYIKEVSKVMREGQQELEIVRDAFGVTERLKLFYSNRKVNSMMAVWSRIQLEGAEKVKSSYGRTQWYTIRRDFAECGISLQGCYDVINRDLPAQKISRVYDFIPLPGERYHVDGVFCDIDEAIAQLELSA